MSIPLRTDVEELFDVPEVRVAAERIMPEPYRDFVNNAGMEETLRGDVAAWGELNLRPRALVDVSNVDTSVTVLGQQIALPVITAPFIGSSFIDPEGEIASARGTAHAGSIMTLSMMGSRTPEQIGPESAGRYWQQLYWVRDRDVVEDMVARAVSAGASALCLTVDLPVMPSFPGRMRDAAQALGEHWGAGEHSMYVARDYRDRPFGATFPNPAVSWSDLEWLRGLSDLPLILKGIVRPEDAVRARDHGASAVVVSNHAGQGLRYSMPVAHALPAIVAAVGAISRFSPTAESGRGSTSFERSHSEPRRYWSAAPCSGALPRAARPAWSASTASSRTSSPRPWPSPGPHASRTSTRPCWRR